MRVAGSRSWLGRGLLSAVLSLGTVGAAAQPSPRSPGWLRFRNWSGVEVQLRGPHGAKLLLVRGARLSVEPDGALVRAHEQLPEGTSVQPLPPHLGGGYVFFASRASRTRLWASQSFTGPLNPLASVSPEVARVVPGLDRLYLVAPADYHALRALDLATGALSELGPLPRTASFGQLSFASAWFGVVEAGIQGALATWDAGQSWHALPLSEPIRDLTPTAEGGLLVASGANRFRLGPQGSWAHWPLRGADAAFDLHAGPPWVEPFDAERGSSAQPDRTVPSLLARAVLTGASVDFRSAWVLGAGQLTHVRLRDGRPLTRRPATDGGDCRGFAHAGAPAFVCQGPGKPTRVLGLLPGGGLERLAAWPQATAAELLPGDLLRVWAGCPPELGARRASELRVAAPGQLEGARVQLVCLTASEGGWHEIPLVLPRQASPLQILPILGNRAEALSVVVRQPGVDRAVRYDGSISATPEPWRATRLALGAGATPEPVVSTLWQRNLTDWGAGVLGAWVRGPRGLVAVELAPDGRVSSRSMPEAATWVHGKRVLIAPGDSELRWSPDGGRTFSSLHAPRSLSAGLGPARERRYRGCTALGCVYDDWLIVLAPGGGLPPPDSPAAAPPARGASVPPGRVDLSCQLARSQPELGAFARVPFARSAPEEGAWLGLGPIPAVAHWGESRAGAASAPFWLSATDPWALTPAWRSAASPLPWGNAAATRAVLAEATAARVILAPTGSALAVSAKVAGDSALLIARPGRPVLRLGRNELGGVGRLLSLAEVRGDLYLLFESEWRLRLARLGPGGPEWVGRYFSFAADARVYTQLGRSAEGGLALFQRSPVAGWFLHPIELPSGRVGSALHHPRRSLAGAQACSEARSGFRVTTHLPLVGEAQSSSRVVLEFPGAQPSPELEHLTARVLVDSAGVCIEGLAARSLSSPSQAKPAARRAPNALKLSLLGPSEPPIQSFWCQPPSKT